MLVDMGLKEATNTRIGEVLTRGLIKGTSIDVGRKRMEFPS
jgi:hypothetical protein